MTDGVQLPLDADQLTRLRHAVLGRTADDAGDPDAEAAQSEAELRHAAVSPNALVEVVLSWTASDEFTYRWPINPMFRAVQGVDRLDRIDPATRPVAHVHIPKTAGTSLNLAISSHLGPNEAVHSRPFEHLLTMPVARLMGLRYLAGHHGFTGADLLRDRDPLVVSMAREPVDMYASMWRYHTKLGLLPPGMSLEQWLRERAKPNIQSRQFLLHLLDGNRGDPRDHDPVDERRTEAMIADFLPHALERIHLLAPTERAAELYLEIHRTVHLPGPPVEFPRANTTEPAPIADEARELIHERSRGDRQFYAAAVQRWSNRAA
ncbi:MAG: Sulfotransferase family [Actinomycetota bacterium]